MGECPTIEELELLARGELEDLAAQRVRAHLELCRQCLERYDECAMNQGFAAQLRQALRDMTPSRLPGMATAAPLPTALTPPLPTIEGYRVVRELHRGGQGVVYEAFQEATRRRVALKILAGGPFAGRASKRRFEREIELAANLRHPHIVAIHDSGIRSGAYYFAMDLVDGQPLNEYAASAGLSIQQKADLFRKICDAVHYAQQRGVIHRDLKPSNILVDTDGEPRVLDFGLAKQISEAEAGTAQTAVSMNGHVYGTLAYMSPEQARGHPSDVDVRTDVYSLGVILYELLCGQYPYDVHGSMPDVLHNIMHADPKRPSTVMRQIDDELETIVLKALAKDKERRYPSAGDLGRDVARYLTGDTIEAKRDSSLYVLRKTLRRYRVPLAVAAAFIVVLVGALVVSVRAQRRAEWQGYLANIGAASRALELHDVVDAGNRLEIIPVRFHNNWEWRHLHSRLDWSLVTLGKEGDPPVTSVAFSPDGSWLASASYDGVVKLWGAVTGEEQRTLRGHSNRVLCVAISPDGTRVASGSEDQTVKLWDARTGEELRTLEGPEYPVGSVAFSPDGKTLVAGFTTASLHHGHIAAWDTATGVTLFKKEAHGWTVGGVAFSPDGRQFITGGEDGYLKIWNSTTGDELRAWRAHAKGVLPAAFDPSGKRVLSGAKDNSIVVWDAETGAEIVRIHGHTRMVTSAVFSPCGKRIASASHDTTVRLWDAKTGDQMACLLGHTSAANSVVFSPDGAVLVSGASDGTVKLWDATSTGAVPTLVGHAGDVNSIAFSPDGTTLASGGRDASLRLWNVATLSEIGRPLLHPAEVKTVAFSPDGLQLVYLVLEQTINVCDVSTRKRLLSFPTDGQRVRAIALSKDGTRIATAGAEETVKVLDARTGATVARLVGHEERVFSVAFSPDSTRVASASDDRTVRLWDVATGTEIYRLTEHAAGVHCVAFSPDGAFIASGSQDRTVKLWDANSGEELNTLIGHGDAVYCVGFSPDSQRLASGGLDHTIKLWDVATGQEVVTLRDHADQVHALAFSPDGTQIASASADGVVKLWPSERPSVRVQDLRPRREPSGQ